MAIWYLVLGFTFFFFRTIFCRKNINWSTTLKTVQIKESPWNPMQIVSCTYISCQDRVWVLFFFTLRSLRFSKMHATLRSLQEIWSYFCDVHIDLWHFLTTKNHSFLCTVQTYSCHKCQDFQRTGFKKWNIGFRRLLGNSIGSS